MAVFQKIAAYWAYPFVRYALIVGVLIALRSSLLGGAVGVLRGVRYPAVHSGGHAGRLDHRCGGYRGVRPVYAGRQAERRCIGMRKTLCALLSGVLALSLCACGQPVEDITVTGEFRSYQAQDGITCYRLVDAVLS